MAIYDCDCRFMAGETAYGNLEAKKQGFSFSLNPL